MSPIRRRRKSQTLIALALAAAAVGTALLLRPQLAEESTAVGSSSAAPSDGAQAAAAATSSAPYTIKAEPTFVATDEVAEPTGGRVDVLLTFAAFDDATGTVQANGFAAGVLEDGGTCTLTLTRGSDTVTATSRATADATTTSCGLLETASRPSAGQWDAVLTYSSDNARGESGAMEVTVP